MSKPKCQIQSYNSLKIICHSLTVTVNIGPPTEKWPFRSVKISLSYIVSRLNVFSLKNLFLIGLFPSQVSWKVAKILFWGLIFARIYIFYIHQLFGFKVLVSGSTFWCFPSIGYQFSLLHRYIAEHDTEINE